MEEGNLPFLVVLIAVNGWQLTNSVCLVDATLMVGSPGVTLHCESSQRFLFRKPEPLTLTA
jgi:hypothetical protein